MCVLLLERVLKGNSCCAKRIAQCINYTNYSTRNEDWLPHGWCNCYRSYFYTAGYGNHTFEGINGNEPTLVQGVVLVVALSFVVINIVVDLLYVLINPRIRTV